jgi:hypothetical protein
MLVRIARIFAVRREPTTRTISPGFSFTGPPLNESFSIFIRIEFVGTGHRNTHRSKSVQNTNALAVLCKDF